MQERVPQSVRDFLPQIPDPMVVITGEQESIEVTRNNYYDQILDYLGITANARRPFTERGSYPLGIDNLEEMTALFSDGKMQASDNYACVLRVQDLAVAGALIIRDEGNFIQGVFYQNLTPEWERKVRERIHNHSNDNIDYIEDPFKT